ncbi:MAG: glutaredoxin family protein [Peptoniphilaceae bacterium]|nr:glutaredoxin family protein [Peptoniphilaceae bacterium]MDY6085480.1 glutaredoxin family protein [Peptoniphilaceae bacterium]
MADVTIYTTPTCVHCKAAKAYMQENDIPYTEKNVVEDTEARAWMNERGYRGVPVIVVDGEEMMGFDPQKFNELVNR